MSLISRIKSKLIYILNSSIKPELIGFNTWNGVNTKNLRISNTSHLSNKANISLGEAVFIGHFNYLDGNQKLTIGQYVQITNYVSILTHSSHHSTRLLGDKFMEMHNHPSTIKDEVEIGEYSYIGAHSIIMPGTKIGKGCIISGFSYVSGDVPDYSIMRGTPAKLIGNTQELDAKLLEQYPDLKYTYYNKS
jgi:acetyltransferase-like isoleucine patch superfamily enzyme